MSFGFEHGYAAMQAMIDAGHRRFPRADIMRFGFTPLYVDVADVLAACEIIEEVIQSGLWQDPKYHRKSRVT